MAKQGKGQRVPLKAGQRGSKQGEGNIFNFRIKIEWAKAPVCLCPPSYTGWAGGGKGSLNLYRPRTKGLCATGCQLRLADFSGSRDSSHTRLIPERPGPRARRAASCLLWLEVLDGLSLRGCSGGAARQGGEPTWLYSGGDERCVRGRSTHHRGPGNPPTVRLFTNTVMTMTAKIRVPFPIVAKGGRLTS
jgi:hypothetical protein